MRSTVIDLQEWMGLLFWRCVVRLLQEPAVQTAIRASHKTWRFLRHMFNDAPVWQRFMPFALACAVGAYALTSLYLSLAW